MTHKRRLESVMRLVFFAAAMTSVLAVLLICLFLFANGLPAFAKIGVFDFLFGTHWAPTDLPPSFGIFPMILGSIYITGGAVLLGVPIGILTAVYLSRDCPPKIYRLLHPAVDLLAGIPSIVYGFFGLMVLVPFVRNTLGGNGMSILTASLLLGIMILPTVIGVSESALRAV
ncbi:MAG: phosphate ABC transporter permease subunit PstC, partial [Oscillospiraceae bacterium]